MCHFVRRVMRPRVQARAQLSEGEGAHLLPLEEGSCHEHLSAALRGSQKHPSRTVVCVLRWVSPSLTIASASFVPGRFSSHQGMALSFPGEARGDSNWMSRKVHGSQLCVLPVRGAAALPRGARGRVGVLATLRCGDLRGVEGFAACGLPQRCIETILGCHAEQLSPKLVMTRGKACRVAVGRFWLETARDSGPHWTPVLATRCVR